MELMAGNKWGDDVDELGGNATLLPYCEFELKEKDVVYMRVASGGGYGDPLERDPRLVLCDVADGLVSPEMAHENYGVVLDQQTNQIDLVATQKLRTIFREQRSTGRNELPTSGKPRNRYECRWVQNSLQ